ncbi:phospho-sugar mutase [Candidatus Methylacidiphilum infernorum]|uniref:Phosphomannomutase n=1 Tax=Methylacidiphilum infernorum (isolate V4) TaxID=481448 RepID=B3DZ89_METI4|nr:phospho-sugar mutase [Candidatus Methylacidiphilum infernorum]ACD84181.1 Phosphomannomutase [Methylacidiphilum infernorum V4]
MNSILLSEIEKAYRENKLLESSFRNLKEFLSFQDLSAVEKESLEELVHNQNWEELDERFYKKLSFGTGGIRGRTIGRIITRAERGSSPADPIPQYPAVGLNCMNDRNVRSAALGLARYLRRALKVEPLKIVISHDSRHFSRYFSLLCAQVLGKINVEAFLFPSQRSTPQLSFTVRWLKAQGGIMITASHNPPYDNGFKAYFKDGCQLVEPHASEVIKEVEALESLRGFPAQEAELSPNILGPQADEAYIKAVETLILEPRAIEAAGKKLKVIYTPLHGTGIEIIPKLFDRHGIRYQVVPSQAIPDGGFPTVKSPNPEDPAALSLAVKLALEQGADIVIGTDPDGDRMGAAVKNKQGEFVHLTGNQIFSLFAHYRTSRLFELGILNSQNAHKAVLIKSFVTTDLVKKIAEHYQVSCVETLTGFKYIGAKLLKYELQCGLTNYDDHSFEERRAAQLQKGKYFICGGEESYGTSCGDYVRDKDANAAALQLVEIAGWAAAHSMSLLDYLDNIYTSFGYFAEKLGTMTFEGPEGSMLIAQILRSYRENPPLEFLGNKRLSFDDFGQQDHYDTEGDLIPKEIMLRFEFENNAKLIIRGSGTEPKIKFYLFTQCSVEEGLEQAKNKATQFLESWWTALREDVKRRISGPRTG